MADHHFIIEYNSTDESTSTSITQIEGDETLHELARMLGGDMITQSAIANAKELKDMAANTKQYQIN